MGSTTTVMVQDALDVGCMFGLDSNEKILLSVVTALIATEMAGPTTTIPICFFCHCEQHIHRLVATTGSAMTPIPSPTPMIQTAPLHMIISKQSSNTP